MGRRGSSSPGPGAEGSAPVAGIGGRDSPAQDPRQGTQGQDPAGSQPAARDDSFSTPSAFRNAQRQHGRIEPEHGVIADFGVERPG